MDKKSKKNMVITKKEHDEWHKQNKAYDNKMDDEHVLCHKKCGITVKG